jgi:hypothetical protein
MQDITRLLISRAPRDALVGAALFWAVLALASGIWPFGNESVAAVLIEPGAGGTHASPAAIVLAGLVFTAIYTANAALVRHLRRVYADTRRSRRPRG